MPINTLSPDDIRERELREWDISSPEQFTPDIWYPYIERLEGLNNLLNKHIIPGDPESRNVSSPAWGMRQELLAKSGIRGGQTNFGESPYTYMSPTSKLRSNPEAFKGSPRTEAMLGHFNNPDLIDWNPNYTPERSSTPTILGHEGAHQPYLRNLQREIAVYLERKVTSPVVDWEPSFSVGFLRDIGKIDDPKHPLYGNKAGPHYMSEIMSFLIGREAELRKGKTLMDDPVVSPLFKDHPGMYQEYTKARNKLRSIK